MFKLNEKERYETVRAMEFLVRHLNNEDHIDRWLTNGVADGDIDEDTPDECLNDYIEDETFAELMDIFLWIMSCAYKSGGLYVNGIVSEHGAKT